MSVRTVWFGPKLLSRHGMIILLLTQVSFVSFPGHGIFYEAVNFSSCKLKFLAQQQEVTQWCSVAVLFIAVLVLLSVTNNVQKDYILLKTQMGNENRWLIEFLRRFGVYTFREWEDPSWPTRSARILSLSEEGVYAETSEKFYQSSVLITHLCL